MNNIFIILILFLFSNSLLSQVESKLFEKKQIICIGEYHHYTGNNEIQISIVDSIIFKSNYENKIIFLETSPELEYFFYLKDIYYLKEYLMYNTDRYFSDSLTKLNNLKFNLYAELLNIINNDASVCVKSIDKHKKLRPVYYTLKYILNRNKKSILYNKYYNKIDSVMNKKILDKVDTLLYYKIKQEFLNNYQALKTDFNEIDFYYINKFFNTPFMPYTTNYMDKRENFMFGQISNNINKNNQIIIIIGNNHIRDKNKRNLRAKLENKYNTIFRKKTLFIGILVTDIGGNKELKKYFDIFIMNEKGVVIFK